MADSYSITRAPVARPSEETQIALHPRLEDRIEGFGDYNPDTGKFDRNIHHVAVINGRREFVPIADLGEQGEIFLATIRENLVYIELPPFNKQIPHICLTADGDLGVCPITDMEQLLEYAGEDIACGLPELVPVLHDQEQDYATWIRTVVRIGGVYRAMVMQPRAEYYRRSLQLMDENHPSRPLFERRLAELTELEGRAAS